MAGPPLKTAFWPCQRGCRGGPPRPRHGAASLEVLIEKWVAYFQAPHPRGGGRHDTNGAWLRTGDRTAHVGSAVRTFILLRPLELEGPHSGPYRRWPWHAPIRTTNKKPAPRWRGRHSRKRVMGLEPTTFTLAT